jgi:hypothetical protein
MSKRKTLRKLFWVWDFEKEEQWLNEMAQTGWALDGVSLCTYHFVACTPGEYTVRLEMHPHDDTYISFMEETGAKYIGRMVTWIYFKKHVEEGEFDIFSDYDSKIKHLNKIGTMLAAIGGANLLIGLANSFNPAINIGWINLLCATLLMYGLGRIHGKIESLKRNRSLME